MDWFIILYLAILLIFFMRIVYLTKENIKLKKFVNDIYKTMKPVSEILKSKTNNKEK